MSETACLKVSTKTNLLERSLIPPDLGKSVENTEVHCLVEVSGVKERPA